MSRRSKTADTPPPEFDRIEGHKLPRETYELNAQETTLARASHAIRSGRVPSAWLIAGPPGVGKATFAYRIARYLLRYGASAEGPADLAVAASDPTSRLIEAQSHPGLLVLARHPDEKGKLPTALSVDEIRRLSGFFGLTAGHGGWRVAIIDTADDMNEQAANALLKTLEEPPRRGLLLVLAHAPGRLLPTIRSRCQRFDLRPLDEQTLAAELAARLLDMTDEDRAALAHLAEGSLGHALRLASEEGVALAREADTLLDAHGVPDIYAILGLGERLARKHDDSFAHFGRFLCKALADRVRTRAESGKGVHLDRWVDVWERLNALFARADALHLDPRQTVLASALALSAAKRQSGSAL